MALINLAIVCSLFNSRQDIILQIKTLQSLTLRWDLWLFSQYAFWLLSGCTLFSVFCRFMGWWTDCLKVKFLCSKYNIGDRYYNKATCHSSNGFKNIYILTNLITGVLNKKSSTKYTLNAESDVDVLFRWDRAVIFSLVIFVQVWYL